MQGTTDTLRLLPNDNRVELRRVFSDHSFVEVFFQRGRVAMTVPSTLGQPQSSYLSDAADMGIVATVAMVADVQVFPMEKIWVSPQEVRDAERVFPPLSQSVHTLDNGRDQRTGLKSDDDVKVVVGFRPTSELPPYPVFF
jgi:hypothetical protein